MRLRVLPLTPVELLDTSPPARCTLRVALLPLEPLTSTSRSRAWAGVVTKAVEAARARMTAPTAEMAGNEVSLCMGSSCEDG
ncbi:hypothetical protein D621_11155 [beta proteobacterium AAP51]|nr:hypothetical protein D621_11155 [beta proteobacterium AAP51]